jgi:hypothetical protein
MRSELGYLPVDKRPAMVKRINSLEVCGKWVNVRSCGGCGEDRTGSARHSVSTCKLRSCPSCSWVRARKTSSFIQDAVEVIEHQEGYVWQFFVLSTRYDPRKKGDLTIEALRSRAMLCQRWAKKAWSKLLKVPGGAMFRAIESSNRGMVHANLVYYGPPADPKAITRLAGDARAGHVYRKIVKPEAVHHVARYAAKGMDHERSGFDEQWLSGETFGATPAPELAARWEFAVFGMHLTQRYGALRGLQFEEHGEVAPDDDSTLCCPSCGCEPAWYDRRVFTDEWIRRCHDEKKPALQGSTWHPGLRRKRGRPPS